MRKARKKKNATLAAVAVATVLTGGAAGALAAPAAGTVGVVGSTALGPSLGVIGGTTAAQGFLGGAVSALGTTFGIGGLNQLGNGLIGTGRQQ